MEISNLPDRIFLCGFMGAGKSIIGIKLAERLGRTFLDLDDKIVESAGMAIPEIFDESGEAGFRAIERRILLEVVREFKGIVALGGGALQNQHLLDHIKLNGLLIFIHTPLSVILDRISQDANRPLLLDNTGAAKDRETLYRELNGLYEDRLPLYEQAVLKIKNDGSQSAEKIVKKLLEKISNHVEYY